MMASLDGVGHDLHGRQVGLGVILTLEIYRRVLATESPDFRLPREAVDSTFWGKISGVVGKEYSGKTERLKTAVNKLSDKDEWDRYREWYEENRQ